MVKIKHKKAFKASLRDAKGPDLKNPYVSPAVPAKGSLARAEDVCKVCHHHTMTREDTPPLSKGISRARRKDP